MGDSDDLRTNDIAPFGHFACLWPKDRFLGSTTGRHRDVLHWLISDTRDERFIDNIFAELCPAPASGHSRQAGVAVVENTLAFPFNVRAFMCVCDAEP
jgi:hypothetical protein